MTRFPDTPFGPVSGDDMAEWCALLNDDNRIHLSREAAQAAVRRALLLGPWGSHHVLLNAFLAVKSVAEALGARAPYPPPPRRRGGRRQRATLSPCGDGARGWTRRAVGRRRG